MPLILPVSPWCPMGDPLWLGDNPHPGLARATICHQSHRQDMWTNIGGPDGGWRCSQGPFLHDDIIKWKHFPCYWPLMRWTVFFDLHLNKWLSKQPRCWWLETPSRSLWCHCKVCSVLGHVRTVSANERRRYISNVFSHWLRRFSHDLRQQTETEYQSKLF